MTTNVLTIHTTKFSAYLRLMRWDKPIGFFLLLWPTLWALWIAAQGVPDTKILIIFLLGVILTRSAGCVINDIADRHIDGHVARTRTRPLAAGTVSTTEALGLFMALCAMCLGLVLMLNKLTWLLAVFALFITMLYPFMKRYVDWPQAFLGIAFSWGVLMAFSAQLDTVPSIAWVLFGIAILWPIAYDTIYAMVDKEDDKKVGVRSTAILFGRFAGPIAIGLQVVMLGLLGWLGYALILGVIYYASLFIGLILCGYQAFLIRHHEPEGCFRAFLNSHWVGAVIFVGFALSYQ